jgi:glyceraldehyde-3-phosphate dehydrogenase/erythrose-4-phosphate dehydrogenase
VHISQNRSQSAGDDTRGRSPVDAGSVKVDGHVITVLAERDPRQLPWKDLGVDIAVESTRHFNDGPSARAHVEAGARKVVITAPAKNEDIILCMGVNDSTCNPSEHHVISNASCPTNCLGSLTAPGARVTEAILSSVPDTPRPLSIAAFLSGSVPVRVTA